jgi:glycosyltransferase involved in cell wall biosynthesis
VPDTGKARLLDLSRLVSRAGRLPTGIDRVELAYLNAFLADSVPVFGLVRSAWGFLLLDRAGCQALHDRLTGQVAWGPLDILSTLRRSLPETRRRAEADLRRVALSRCLPFGLARMLRRHLPQGATYVNVGHANLTARVLSAVKQSLSGAIVVMLHDTIPLDYPQYQRPGATARFRGMLARVQRDATLILCNSAATRADVVRHMTPAGEVPETLVAWLGVDPARPDPTPRFPAGFDKNRPYFVSIGTIEPRKNHIFLLDLWQWIATDTPPDRMPQLVICGARGWNNAATFARLDNDPLMGRHVFEATDMTDGQIAALTAGARGALFPSFAEGFGLPPVEALSQGCPVICNSLEIYAEILGDYPVYAQVGDRYSWRQAIERLTHGQDREQAKGSGFQAPDWQSHFNVVLSRL